MVATASITDELARLLPPAETPEFAYGDAFRAIAELLLDRAVVVIAERPHRFTELEFYFDGRLHPDPFTHGDPMQRELGRWYFHRSGTTYRGGTYKGVDIAIGSADVCAGILIRGIAEIRGATLIDGPCMVVDHILALAKAHSVADLANSFDLAIAPTARSPLYVEVAATRGTTLYATPRIGLTLKKGHTPVRHRLLARPYRFLSEPSSIKKGRPHLVTSLHQLGHSALAIAEITRCRPNVIASYITAFESGRGKPIESFGTELSPSELCGLLGALASPRA
jgi:hypothetical protein